MFRIDTQHTHTTRDIPCLQGAILSPRKGEAKFADELVIEADPEPEPVVAESPMIERIPRPRKKPRRRKSIRPASARVTPALLSVRETAVLLACSTRTIWRLVRDDWLRTVNLNRSVRILREDVQRFIRAGGTKEAA